MTSKFLRPTLMALAVSTGPAFFFMAQAAERWIRRWRYHQVQDTKSYQLHKNQTRQTERCRDGSLQDGPRLNEYMDHSKIGAMDHSDNGQMDGMEAWMEGRLPQAEL